MNLATLLDPDKTLFIIGNGFDIAHGVASQYTAFRDFLEKRHSNVLSLFNFYINDENLWSDFETALGKLDVNAMINEVNLDMWLDDYEAYDGESSVASFYAAIESAASPAIQLSTELPEEFRRWVETLQVGNEKRPYEGMIVDGKVLNFNYTEFIETLYGVSSEHVCYIHGCRRKVKGQPKEELIIGHRPEEIIAKNIQLKRSKLLLPSHKRSLIKMAANMASEYLSWYDSSTTKNCQKIIENHREFFDGLSGITDVVVIGHSLSPVDWDYFREVIKRASPEGWHISYHKDEDLKRVEAFVNEMQIRDYKTFRV